MSTSTVAPPTTLTVHSAALKAAAQWVARIIPTRPAVPILGAAVLTTADDGALTLAAFDFDTYGTIDVDVAGELDGPVLVHGRMLAEAAARLAGDVTLTVDATTVALEARRQRFRLNRMDGGDYPQTPKAADSTGAVDVDDLREVIERAAVATARDNQQGLNLNALHLTAVDGVLTIVATDRYRAARTTLPWPGDDLDVITPAASLTGALRGITGPVSVGANASHLTVAAEDRSVTISRVAGDYPKVEQLLDNVKLTDTPIRVDRADLVDAVAAGRVVNDRGTPLVLDFTPGVLEVSGSGDASEASAVIDVDADVEVRLAVNAEYLADLLGALPGPVVHLTPGPDPRLPFRLLPADAAGDPIPGTEFLLVPIRAAVAGVR